MIKLVLAVSLNNVIGNNNELPWHIPEELQVFKLITYGHSIVMGYNTYKSLRNPLPNRENYVIVKPNTELREGFIPIQYEEAIDLGKEKDIYIIGGSKIYKKVMDDNCVDVAYISHIFDVDNGNTAINLFFDPREWEYSVYKKTDKFMTVKYERRSNS